MPNLRPINKYNILNEIQCANHTLFYKLLTDHIAQLAPIVYTPTVGEACVRFDAMYREPMGMYISAFLHRGRFAEILRRWPSHAVQIAVVTDGSRILGLGDLGTNGMGIPVGKVSLFVAAGGFHPEHALPLLLDVGTNNETLLKDKFYMVRVICSFISQGAGVRGPSLSLSLSAALLFILPPLCLPASTVGGH